MLRTDKTLHGKGFGLDVARLGHFEQKDFRQEKKNVPSALVINNKDYNFVITKCCCLNSVFKKVSLLFKQPNIC